MKSRISPRKTYFQETAKGNLKQTNKKSPFNPFHVTGLFLFLQKTSENQRFFYIFIEVLKKTSGTKWVFYCFIIYSVFVWILHKTCCIKQVRAISYCNIFFLNSLTRVTKLLIQSKFFAGANTALSSFLTLTTLLLFTLIICLEKSWGALKKVSFSYESYWN